MLLWSAHICANKKAEKEKTNINTIIIIIIIIEELIKLKLPFNVVVLAVLPKIAPIAN